MLVTMLVTCCPNYQKIQKSFYHLRDITLNDTDTKKKLPEAEGYTKI